MVLEGNPDKLRELATQLHFLLSEHHLKIQNKAVYISHQIQQHYASAV